MARLVDACDWENAVMEDSKPVRILLDALLEREMSHGYYWRPGDGGDGGSRLFFDFHRLDCAPANLRILHYIRDRISILAEAFACVDDETYAYRQYRNFPRSYTREEVLSGDHIKTLPMSGVPASDPGAIAIYRKFLSECVEWLCRFRYVHLAYGSDVAWTYTSGEASWSRTYEKNLDGETIDEDGENVNSISLSENTDSADPRFSEPHFSVSTERYAGFSQGGDGIYDTRIRDESERMNAGGVGFTNLRVWNKFGRPAKCLLFPCGVGSEAHDSYERTYEYTEGRTTNPSDSRPMATAGGILKEIGYYHGLGGFECETKRESMTYAAGTKQATEITTTRWSEDRTRHLSTTTRTEAQQADPQNKMWSWTSNTHLDYELTDAFGLGQIGTPIDCGEIGPHEMKKVHDGLASLPLASMEAVVDVSKRSSYASMTHEAVCRLVPILDFNDSFNYKA